MAEGALTSSILTPGELDVPDRHLHKHNGRVPGDQADPGGEAEVGEDLESVKECEMDGDPECDIECHHDVVQVETHSIILEEGGVKLSLTVVDTPGFGDKVTEAGCKPWDISTCRRPCLSWSTLLDTKDRLVKK